MTLQADFGTLERPIAMLGAACLEPSTNLAHEAVERIERVSHAATCPCAKQYPPASLNPKFTHGRQLR